MKQKLLVLHLLFLIATLAIIVFAITEGGNLTILILAASALVFVFLIFSSWMKYLAELVTQSGQALSEKHKSSSPWSFNNFTLLNRNHEQVIKKLKVSADSIANLARTENTLATDELLMNDPIGDALQKIRFEMQKLKEEEDKHTWVSQGLARFSEILRNKGEVKEYSYQIISNLVKYIHANQGGLYIEYNTEKQERYLELAACYAYDKRKHVEGKIAEGQGLLGQCMLEKDFVFLTDVPKDYVKITSGLGEATPRNIVVAPLIFNETFFGAIELALFKVMKPHELEFLKKVCENIASEIASLKNIQQTQVMLNESNQLTLELQTREEEMKQNLEELAATQEEMARKQSELSGILNAIDSTLATAEFDTQGKLIKYNSIMEDIFGFNRVQFCTKDITLIIGKESDASFIQILHGKVKGGDFFTRCCNGESVWLSATFTVVHDPQGEPVKVLSLFQNITEKKKQEKEFERLSLVADNTDNSVIITDAGGITEYVNEGFTKMTGYSADEIIGRKPGDLLQGEDTDAETVLRIREKIEARQPIYEEILNYNKKGEAYWVSIAINPVFNKKGELENFISIQANITATKNASLDFRYKLEAISRSNAIIEFDNTGNILDANDNFLKLTEYSLDEIKGKHHRIFMHEGEAEKTTYQEFWKKLGRGEFISDEFERKTKRGKSIWLKGIYNPIFDMNGKTRKIVKFAVDISGEKRLQRLTQKKQKELNSYLDSINNTVASAEFEPNGKFKGANEIFLRVMGYKQDEIVGQPFDFFMGDDPAVIMMWENLRLGKFFSGEFKMKDKTGKDLWLTGTFNPIVVDGNTPQKIMMLAQFTTQEKEKFNDLNTLVHALKSTLPVLEMNEQFVCKTANEKFFKLFGISRLDLRSKSILDFIDPYYHGTWKKRQGEILTQEFISLKLPIKKSDHTASYEVSISVARSLDGHVSRVILLLVKEVEERVPVLAVV